MNLGTTTGVDNIGSVFNVRVIEADQTRVSLIFQNPNVVGRGISIMLSQIAHTVNSSGQGIAPTFIAPGGGWVLDPGEMIVLTGNIQGAWQAIAASGSQNGLTINSSSNA